MSSKDEVKLLKDNSNDLNKKLFELKREVENLILKNERFTKNSTMLRTLNTLK